MSKVKVIFSLLLVSNLVFALGFFVLAIHYGVFGMVIGKITGESSPVSLTAELNYDSQTSLYEIYPTEETKVVMLGDSLTFNADWNELLERSDIVNRGIGNDTTEGILQRLDYIEKVNPDYVFVMAGINDFIWGSEVDQTFENYKSIIERLQESDIKPVIQSVVYTSEKYIDYEEVNSKVGEINALLEEYAAENNVEYLDLNQILSENQQLKKEYTYDGIHFYGSGYQVWSEEVKGLIEKSL